MIVVSKLITTQRLCPARGPTLVTSLFTLFIGILPLHHFYESCDSVSLLRAKSVSRDLCFESSLNCRSVRSADWLHHSPAFDSEVLAC